MHGKLLKEEAMLVESHISSCALCSDAIDGYMMQESNSTSLLPVTAKDDFLKKVNEINATAKENKQPEKVISTAKIELPSFKVQIRKWYVAACILLILSTGIFTVYSYYKTQQGTLAKNNKSGKNKVAAKWEKAEDKSNELVKIKVSPQESIVASSEDKTTISKNNDLKTAKKNTSHVEEVKSPPTVSKTTDTKTNFELENDKNIAKEKTIVDNKDNNYEPKKIQEDYAAVQNNYKEEAAPVVEKPALAVSEKPAAAGMRNISNDNNIQSNAPTTNLQYTELGKNKKTAQSQQVQSIPKNELNSPYDNAMQLYKNKDYTKCIEQLKVALNNVDASKKEDIYYYFALCYENIQDEQNALVYWNKLLNSNKYREKAEKKTDRFIKK